MHRPHGAASPERRHVLATGAYSAIATIISITCGSYRFMQFYSDLVFDDADESLGEFELYTELSINYI